MQIKKRPIILEYQSNIASKAATGMQRYTVIKDKHSSSLKAVELGSLVQAHDKSKLEITGHTLSVTVTLQNPRNVSAERLN